jgi:hypothetical protein
MTDDLVKRLRSIEMDHDNGEYWHTIDEAADRIIELETVVQELMGELEYHGILSPITGKAEQ